MAARLAPGPPVPRWCRIRPGESDAIAAGLNPLEPAPDADGRAVPAADPRRPGQGAVHRLLPVRGAVPAGAERGADQGVRGCRVGHGARRDAPGRPEPRLPEPDRPAAGRDQDRPGDRLQPADHRRRARLHQGAAVQPAAGHHRPVPGGRPSARLRQAAADQRGARDRGRRRRQGQGVPDGDGADQAGRAPADGEPGASRRRGHGLRHLTVIEEAHRLLRRQEPGGANGAAAHAVEMFAGLLAEIRAYGEGLVIAEQIPDGWSSTSSRTPR